MPARVLRFIHAAHLRLDAPLAPSGVGPLDDDLRRLLDEATIEAFSRIVTTAIEQDADALIITGNTFDAAAGSLSADVALQRELRRLNQDGLPVFITPGLLDPSSAWREIPSLPDNVTLFLQGNEAGVDLTDRGRKLAVILPVSATTGVDAPELENLRAVGSLAGERRGFTIGMWIPRLMEEGVPIQAGFSSLNYLAAGKTALTSSLPLTEGHVHLQAGAQGLDATETGWRGCQLIDVDAAGEVQARLIPVAPVRWETCVVDGRGVIDRDELCERMLGQIEQFTSYPGEKLRIITWRLDQQLLEAADVFTAQDIAALQATLVELSDQPKKGLRYLHRVEPVWDEQHLPAAVDRELWDDFLAQAERWNPLELEHLVKLWEQHAGTASAPAGWPNELRWPPVESERVRRRALQNGRRWFSEAKGGASR